MHGRRSVALLTATATLLAVHVLNRLGWLGGVEGALLNSCYRLRGDVPGSAEVVVVAVEPDPDGSSPGWTWPPDAGTYARLIESLHRGGAAVIALDVAGPLAGFAWQGREDSGETLAKAIRDAGNVVLPAVLQPPGRAGAGEAGACVRFACGEGELLAPPELRDGRLATPSGELCEAAAGLGHLNLYPDPDGVIRSSPLMVSAHGLLWPSLALEVARVRAGLEPGAARLEDDRVVLGNASYAVTTPAEMFITFAGGFRHFPHFRLAEVLGADDETLRKTFAGKVVLVGPTSSDLTTLWRTPVHPVLPGVEINASVVSNLLLHNELRRARRWVPGLLALLVAVVLGWTAVGLGAVRVALLALGLLIAGQVALVMCFVNGLWVPMAEPLVTAVVVGIVLVARAASAADRQRAQAEAGLESRLGAIAGIGALIVSARDKAQLLEQIVRWVETELDVPAVSILLLDERQRKLRFEIASGEKGDQVKAFTLDLGQGVAGMVAQSGEPLIVDEARKDPRQAHDIAEAVGYPTDRVLCVPMKLHGAVIGVIEALNKRSGPFTLHDQSLLSVIANQASLFLENASFYSELQQRVDEATAGLRAANRDLAAQKAKIETLVDQMDAGVIATDYRDRVVMWNRTVGRLLGVPESQAIGQPLLSVVSHPTLSELFAMPLSPMGGRHEAEVELASGAQPVVVRASLALIDEGDEQVGKLAVLTDITRLKELDRWKNDLISFVSHELKNPLASIKGFVELLERRMSGDSSDLQLIRVLGHQTTRMRRLVDDFLEVTRIEAGMALELNYSEIGDLRGMIQQIVDIEAMTAPSHQFTVQVAPDLGPLYADRAKLEQVLVNLVNNAVKYSPEGGEVRVSVVPSNDEAVFAVSDQGIGIRPEELPNLFQRYRRARNARRRVEGTGIGLFLSRHLVEAHGGRIWVETGESGSTFRFALPLDPRRNMPEHEDAPPDTPEAG